MPLNARRVRELVSAELARLRDPVVCPRIEHLLVEPRPVQRRWDYGSPDEQLECWVVLEHQDSSTGIAYCDRGFGPENAWGLIGLEGSHLGIGTAAAWFPSLEIAAKESPAWDDQGGTLSQASRAAPNDR